VLKEADTGTGALDLRHDADGAWLARLGWMAKNVLTAAGIDNAPVLISNVQQYCRSAGEMKIPVGSSADGDYEEYTKSS
jgi:hypothetical protein